MPLNGGVRDTDRIAHDCTGPVVHTLSKRATNAPHPITRFGVKTQGRSRMR